MSNPLQMDDREAMAWQLFVAKMTGNEEHSAARAARQAFEDVGSFIYEMDVRRNEGQR